jgi:hypothetical protein
MACETITIELQRSFVSYLSLKRLLGLSPARCERLLLIRLSTATIPHGVSFDKRGRRLEQLE